MLLSETFTALQSFGLILAVSSSVFLWRFHAVKRKIMHSLKVMPTIAVVGPKLTDRSQLIKYLSFTQPVKIFKGLYQSVDKQMFLIDVDLEDLDIKKLLNINLKRMLYVFDLSRLPLEQQIEEFKRLTKNLKVECIPVVVSASEKEGLKSLEEKLGKVYKAYALDLEKELEDIKLLQEMLKGVEKVVAP
ncbi:MAG: hypothetical protein RMI30_05740 [Thermodesulfovibrio sp.]|nr:hypothetical protein [Thermodesulfovibrio sp.]